MVVRNYIKCPICGKLYQLKIQYDMNLMLYPWPITFECEECGEQLSYTYSQKGLLPKAVYYMASPTDAPITTIGYSSSLPITVDIYMQDLDYTQSIALFSPFMNIQHGYFTMQEVTQFDAFLKRLQTNFLPYRDVMHALLPILKKGNVVAYSKKLAKLFNEKTYTPLGSQAEAFDSFMELVEASYRNLCPTLYEQQYKSRYVTPLFDRLRQASSSDIKAIKEKLDESGKISVWYKDESLPYIAHMLAQVHKLIPAMIYASAGVNDVASRGDLKILTIAWKEVTDYYKDGYEVFAKGLKIIVGLTNLLENGDMNTFLNPKLASCSDITAFAQLTSGQMTERLSDYATVNDYLAGSMNNKVRNAASHNGIVYHTTSQQLECQYNAADRSKILNTTLMEVSFLCYLQLLHLMEATLLARQIVKAC